MVFIKPPHALLLYTVARLNRHNTFTKYSVSYFICKNKKIPTVRWFDKTWTEKSRA